jgi:thioredoxin reductase (NADPH)
MATKPTISDDILGALIARRETVRTTSAAQAIQIIGSRFSREALALRTFAARNRTCHPGVARRLR